MSWERSISRVISISFPSVLGRESVLISLSHSASSGTDAGRRRTWVCIEDEDAARGVDGRWNSVLDLRLGTLVHDHAGVDVEVRSCNCPGRVGSEEHCRAITGADLN